MIPYLFRSPAGSLYAKERGGLILIEYRENGRFLNIEVVSVRSDKLPDGPVTRTDIGFQLKPLCWFFRIRNSYGCKRD